jgi:hypothetical protein
MTDAEVIHQAIERDEAKIGDLPIDPPPCTCAPK